MSELERIFYRSRALAGPNIWKQILKVCPSKRDPGKIPQLLQNLGSKLCIPGFLTDLSRLELALHKVERADVPQSDKLDQLTVNPSVNLIRTSWSHLTSLLMSEGDSSSPRPQPGEEWTIVWWDPRSDQARIRTASDEDLLVLKLLVEAIEPRDAAKEGGVPVGAIDAAVRRAVGQGILLVPPSSIRRDSNTFPVGKATDESFLWSPVFTLQWHITNACDLHCKHCYDRSNRRALGLDQSMAILDDLYEFCRNRHVSGQVSFSGGNPLLYPYFLEVYHAAVERGFSVAILGNPTSQERMQELLAIARPVFFQVSLEGLPEHNDTIRGQGHFNRVMEFLKVLRDLDIYSMVMLTLTRDNMAHVLPLADTLKDRVDLFTFNRLSMVGEGANLVLPGRDQYADFLEAYTKAAETNPVISLKDNLLNIVRYQRGLDLFGGCTGHGCGAAFNFLCLLPDGEVHACRKFPSLLGNILTQSIGKIYDSSLASRYRSGSAACWSCEIRPVCGGCLASAYSYGRDIFEEQDPFCFMNRAD